jgi:hypothetical protein
LRIIWHNFLLDIWHDGCSGSLIGKGALLPHARRCFRQKRTVGNIWQLGGEQRRISRGVKRKAGSCKKLAKR